ncbi:MAG: hypothetical protein QXH80_00410 [Candidatus Nanoarchaeia archaeon]
MEEIREKKLSIDEIGLEILAKNLKLEINPEKLSMIFNLLADDKLEQAENAIEGKFEIKPEVKAKYTTTEVEAPVPQEPVALQTKPAPEEARLKMQAQSQTPQVPARKAPDPTTLYLAESGLSMLGMGGGKSAPKPPTPKPIPTPVQQAPARKAPDPETKRLAEAGLSMLGMGGGSSKSAPRPPAAQARPVASVQSSGQKVMLTQSGKVSGSDAAAGLSMLASSDHRAKPIIRMKESPGAQTVQKIAGQPHAKLPSQSPPPRRIRFGDDDDIIIAKKSTFDLKKFLNKER